MLLKLLKIIIVFALIIFAYRFARQQGLVKGSFFDQSEAAIAELNPWQEKAPEFNLDLEKLGADGLTQVNTLASKAKDAGSVAQDFV